jgi:hypothetical protein
VATSAHPYAVASLADGSTRIDGGKKALTDSTLPFGSVACIVGKGGSDSSRRGELHELRYRWKLFRLLLVRKPMSFAARILASPLAGIPLTDVPFVAMLPELVKLVVRR